MSKIKIFHALSIYSSFIKQVYKKHPELSITSYDNQINKLFEEGFGWLNNWSYYVNNSEEFELFACITDVDVAQLKWAEENNIVLKDKEWRVEVLIAQIKLYKPDILFAHDSHIFKEILVEIKNQVPSIKIVFGWDGVLMHDLELFKNYDLILSPVKETVDFYKKNKKLSFEFNFGFQPEVLKKIIIRDKRYDFAFIGQVSPIGQHSERFEYLAELNKTLKIDLWTPSLGFTDWKRYYYYQFQRIMKLKLNEAIIVNTFRKNNHGDVYGKEMFQAVSDSKLVFNKHINQVGNYAANIRLFEVTGAGSCLITDYKENLEHYFDIEREIVTFKTKDELISKVKFLISNDIEREKIAKAGQHKTLTLHNYQLRFNLFFDFLKEQFLMVSNYKR